MLSFDCWNEASCDVVDTSDDRRWILAELKIFSIWIVVCRPLGLCHNAGADKSCAVRRVTLSGFVSRVSRNVADPSNLSVFSTVLYVNLQSSVPRGVFLVRFAMECAQKGRK